MIKVKFRVFVTKYCNGTYWPCDEKPCKIKHEFPTHRYIFHQAEGDADNARQKCHAYACYMLESENKRDKDKKKQQRPLWQYDIEVA